MKPVLVGLHNPHSRDPAMALAPHPPNSAGWRLMRILGMDILEYAEAFDRVNLLPGGEPLKYWSETYARRARLSATILLANWPYDNRPRGEPRHWILLGARVCRAFAIRYEPCKGYRVNGDLCTVLPHPSGRCRKWSGPGVIDYVRHLGTESLYQQRTERNQDAKQNS